MSQNPIFTIRWLFRLLLFILAVLPLFYWQSFYDHFYAYLTGAMLSKVIVSQWRLVLLSILFFSLFLIPLNYRRRAKWVDYGLGMAFFVSLFIEMYGAPLTILFASKYFFTAGANIPPNIIEFSFLGVGLGMDHAMAYGAVLMALGIIFITFGWWSLYRQVKLKTFAKNGLYAVSRHPQYLGFILLILGWFFGWPTIVTAIFSPVLIYQYLRAALSEEKEAEAAYGADYRAYRQTTPFLI